MAAFDLKGQIVNTGDQVSVLGSVTAVGSGSNPNVTIQPPLSPNTYTVTARNLRTTEGGANGGVQGNAIAVGNDCTVVGVVSSISGSGNTATLTIVLQDSGILLNVPAGACYSNGA